MLPVDPISPQRATEIELEEHLNALLLAGLPLDVITRILRLMEIGISVALANAGIRYNGMN